MTAADLLARYARNRDAEAFATLVSDYQSMVLATCRRRLRSANDVDDAVQETFLKLAKNAGTLRTNVAAWLHRCAINVSADINRRGATRERHETASAVENDTGESAQRELAELREHLDAALEKLDEPTRELILQRFFVGRSQVDIARDAGVTPSAISQRLDRAIELLRSHLGSGGTFAIAGAGLAALLSAEHASAAAAPALTASLNAIGLAGTPRLAPAAPGGGVAIGTWSAIAAAIAALLSAVGATILFRDQTSVPAPSPSRPSRTPVGTLTFRSEAKVATAPTAPIWSDKPVDPVGVLSGRITDVDGHPIAGALVHMSDVATGPSTTDADGRYSFASVPRGGEYRLAVTASGFARLGGDTNGRDVAIRLSPGAKARRDFVLQRTVRVSAALRSASGEPLRNPRVAYLPLVPDADDPRLRMHDRDVYVSAEGVALVVLPVGATDYAILVSAGGHAPRYAIVSPRSVDESTTLPMTLERGVNVAGTAICRDGKPAAGWQIEMRPADWPGRSDPSAAATIDAAGNFVLTNVMPGDYDLSLRFPNGADSTVVSSPLGRFRVAPNVPLALAIPMNSPGALATMSGTVQWTGELADAPQAVIEAWPVADPTRVRALRLAYNALKGREAPFTLANLEPGEYAIRVDGQNVAPVRLDNVRIPGVVPPLELRAFRTARLAGIVTDARSGRPVTNFAYRLWKLATIGDGRNYQPTREWLQIGDDDGTFVADLAGPGEYQVQLSAPGYATAWSPRIRIETLGINGTAELRLSVGGGLRGTVLDSDGSPIVGAKVIPASMNRTPSSPSGGQRVAVSDEDGVVATDAAGRFEIAHLAAGTETLYVSHGDFMPATADNIVVAEAAVTDVPAISLKRRPADEPRAD